MSEDSDWVTQGGWSGDPIAFTSPAVSAAGWKPGQTRAYAPVVCCPRCSSLRVYHVGRKKPEHESVWYHCQDCKERWKMLDHKIGKAIVIA